MMQGEDFLDYRDADVENSWKIKAPDSNVFMGDGNGAGRSKVQYTLGASYTMKFGPGNLASIKAGVAVNTPIMYTNDNDKTASTEKWGKGPVEGQRLLINVPIEFSVSF